MDVSQWITATLQGLTVLVALLLLFSRDLVKSAYLLTGVMVCLAGLFASMKANFLVAVQILIYGGGVVVLLVVSIMVAARSQGVLQKIRHKGVIPVVAVVLPTLLLLLGVFSQIDSFPSRSSETQFDATRFGLRLTLQHLLSFELLGVIFLVVLVGAYYFASSGRRRFMRK